MKISNLILLLIIGFELTLCTPEKPVPNSSINWFPDKPKNIVGLNTVFDDYNSNINAIGKRIDLYYSTNKETQGENFDISSRCIDAVFNLDNNNFVFDVANDFPYFSNKLLPLINTVSNEFGPFSFYSDSLTNSNTWWYFMYANNEKGNFDIRFVSTNVGDWGHYQSSQQINGPFNAKILNSDYDDFYPTINADNDMVNLLQNGTNKPTKNNLLSSPHDDKCPYIKGHLMVFTSNNTAGYGGYDLWYSVFENGKWNTPQNFGSEINTKYDEYRPAIEFFPDSKNDLMIFSSNRPEGKGGYDLYYTGISKMIKK